MKLTHLPFRGQFKLTYIYGIHDPKRNKTVDKTHQGIDLVGIDDKGVYSTTEGTVIFAGYDNSTGYGNLVKIIDEYDRIHLFAHLETIEVEEGNKVNGQTKLGSMGNTGRVRAAHLHYEIRENDIAVNPSKYLDLPNSYGLYNTKNTG